MCGVCGIISRRHAVEENVIREMNSYLSKRGPDSSGIFLDKNIGLGHTRLSIQDLSSNGHQPMRVKGAVISFNGEVFNFKELKKELEVLGYTFKSDTDTEVVATLYNHYGIDFVSRLNGMFAMAIYDEAEQLVYLIRDRYGIKPLYIYTDDNTIIFSSDLKSIVRQKGCRVTIDSSALKEYFKFLYIRNPRTPYNEIKKMQVGYYYSVNIKNLEVKKCQYYDINSKPIDYQQTEEEIVSNIDDLLHDSIAKRMISDLEVGSFLSGGVDSSIVTAIASQHTSQRIQTFSIGYKGLNEYFDETKYALNVSKQYNTKHHVLSLDFEKTFSEFEEIIYELDEPIADTSVFLNYYLSKLTKEHVTVALSGLGADELFGGYNRHQAVIVGKKLRELPAPVKAINKILNYIPENRTSSIGNKIRQAKKLLSSVDGSMSDTYMRMISYSDIDSDRCLNIDSAEPLRSVLKDDIQYYMNDNLLNLSDKMTMASSLEMRVPFLDYRLVNYSMTIDSRLKTSVFNKKIILKKLAERYISENLIYRRKQGFAAPVEIWMKQQGIHYIRKVIDFEFLSKFIQLTDVNKDIDLFFNRGTDKALQVYSYIVLSFWYRINGEFISD